jgi:cytochrome o ubiquinol oxidase operon protein cyoD
MSAHHSDPLDNPEVQQGTTLRFAVAFLASVLFMGAALLVSQHKLPFLEFAEIVVGLTFLTLAAQATLFFGLDISRAQIWKSVSLILTVPLFIISVGLTVWAFSSLYSRTMLPANEVPSMSMPMGSNATMSMPAQQTLLQ